MSNSPVSKALATPFTKPSSSAAPGQSSSSHFNKQITSQRIADDIAAFHKQGGRIEVLGVTRVEFNKKKVEPTAPTIPGKK
jgi:hypothetical protein